MSMSKTYHELKCIQPFFNDVKLNLKKFEIRYDDRNYQVGDYVSLNLYDPVERKFPGEKILVRITYLIRGTVCLKSDYCAFGFEKIHKISGALREEKTIIF